MNYSRLVSHYLDKDGIDSVVLALVVKIDIVEAIKTMFSVFISSDWCVYWSAFFPPKVGGLLAVANDTIWIIVQADPFSN